MKLNDVPMSVNCSKVRVMARELGLNLELIPVDLFAPRAGDYLAQNPIGKVPTFVDDEGLVEP